MENIKQKVLNEMRSPELFIKEIVGYVEKNVEEVVVSRRENRLFEDVKDVGNFAYGMAEGGLTMIAGHHFLPSFIRGFNRGNFGNFLEVNNYKKHGRVAGGLVSSVCEGLAYGVFLANDRLEVLAIPFATSLASAIYEGVSYLKKPKKLFGIVLELDEDD